MLAFLLYAITAITAQSPNLSRRATMRDQGDRLTARSDHRTGFYL
jgi:hypothetical protein